MDSMRKLVVVLVLFVHSIALADWNEYWANPISPVRVAPAVPVSADNCMEEPVTASLAPKEFLAWDCWLALKERLLAIPRWTVEEGDPIPCADLACTAYIPKFNRYSRENLVEFKRVLGLTYGDFADPDGQDDYLSTPLYWHQGRPVYPAGFKMLDIESLAKAIPTFPHKISIVGTKTNYLSNFFVYTPLYRASATGDDPELYERNMTCEWDMCFWTEDSQSWDLPICNETDPWSGDFRVIVTSENVGNGKCYVDVLVRARLLDPNTGAVIEDNSQSWNELIDPGQITHIELTAVNQNIYDGFTEADYGWETCQKILKLMSHRPIDVEVAATIKKDIISYGNRGTRYGLSSDVISASGGTESSPCEDFSRINTSGTNFVIGDLYSVTSEYTTSSIPTWAASGYLKYRGDVLDGISVRTQDPDTRWYPHCCEASWVQHYETKSQSGNSVILNTTSVSVRVPNDGCVPVKSVRMFNQYVGAPTGKITNRYYDIHSDTTLAGGDCPAREWIYTDFNTVIQPLPYPAEFTRNYYWGASDIDVSGDWAEWNPAVPTLVTNWYVGYSFQFSVSWPCTYNIPGDWGACGLIANDSDTESWDNREWWFYPQTIQLWHISLAEFDFEYE